MADDQYNLICTIRGWSQITSGKPLQPKWRICRHPLPVIGSDSTTDLTYRLYRAARAAIYMFFFDFQGKGRHLPIQYIKWGKGSNEGVNGNYSVGRFSIIWGGIIGRKKETKEWLSFLTQRRSRKPFWSLWLAVLFVPFFADQVCLLFVPLFAGSPVWSARVWHQCQPLDIERSLIKSSDARCVRSKSNNSNQRRRFEKIQDCWHIWKFYARVTTALKPFSNTRAYTPPVF